MLSKGIFSSQFVIWIVISVCFISFYFTNYFNKLPSTLDTPTPQKQTGRYIRADFPIQKESSKRYEGKRLSCEVLLSNGSLVCQEDTSSILNCSIAEKIWKPDGCDMHVHTFSELGKCITELPNKKVYMIGDSRIRHIYDSFKSRLKGLEYSRKMQIWQDMIYKNRKKGMSLKFFWHPFVNKETLQTLVEITEREKRADVLLFGNALHTIWKFNGTGESILSYTANFTKIIPILKKLTSRTKVIWMIQPPIGPPFMDEDNAILNRFNDIAVEQLRGTRVHVMHSSKRIGESTLDAYLDGCHLGKESDRMIVEILLNFICNEHITTEENTCCDGRSLYNF